MTITALPTPPLRTDPTNFAVRADAFLAALPTFVTEANATATAMNLNATTDTSASSVLIGTGSKSFTVSAAKSFQPGMWLLFADTAAPTVNSLVGQVSSYNSATGALVVDVPANGALGSGTKTAWTITLTAKPSADFVSPAMQPVTSAATLAAARSALGAAASSDIVGKNKLINPNFAINQRGVTGTVVLAAGAYGHDRFKAGAGGCTYTFATSLNVTSITISAGTLMQVIKGSNLSSGTHTLSWTGTATARIDSGSYGASGITGTAVGGTNQTCEWGTGTVSKVQYEMGAVATTFEQRLDPHELVLCQAYCELGSVLFAGYGLAANNVSTCYSYKAKKQATPTLTQATNGVLLSAANVGATSSYLTDQTSVLVFRTATATVQSAFSETFLAVCEL